MCELPRHDELDLRPGCGYAWHPVWYFQVLLEGFERDAVVKLIV